MNGYKLVLLGDAQVGKTTLMNRLSNGMFLAKYEPTEGVDLTTFAIQTNHGDINFIVWDTAGQEELAGLRDGYYIGAQCAIIMIDVNSPTSFENWHRDLRRVRSEIPVVICGNKNGIMRDRMGKNLQIFFGRRNLVYYDISVKFKNNLDKPFLYLARQLTGDQTLKLAMLPKLLSLMRCPEVIPPEEEIEC